MDNIYINTLTHDIYTPWVNGFCFNSRIDEDGQRLFEHNGLNYITREDIEAIENFLVFIKAYTGETSLINDTKKESKKLKNPIYYLFLGGMKQIEISKRLGISKQAVSEYVKKHNLKELFDVRD